MTEYGVQPTGFVRKPLSVILAEIEEKMITEFGGDVIQSPQSPLGQLNGIYADFSAQIWELAENVYNSLDIDQAEGTRLNALARLRLLNRTVIDDVDFRRVISNDLRTRIDISDFKNALDNIPGVEFSAIFSGDSDDPKYQLDAGVVSIAMLGGEDEVIAGTLREYIAPGISTYGNAYVNSDNDGFCRNFSLVRPILVPVSMNIKVRKKFNNYSCPAPTSSAIKDLISNYWILNRLNGQNISHYLLRKIIESNFDNLEAVEFTGYRSDSTDGINQDVNIEFFEIATISVEDIDIDFMA